MKPIMLVLALALLSAAGSSRASQAQATATTEGVDTCCRGNEGNRDCGEG